MTARIDVLIPAYNVAATVREAVNSILTQTEREIRVIIIDDGSNDATPRILAELARGDARIILITKENGGIVDALNEGLKLCAGEFIARFDADDVSYPDRLERQLAYLEANIGCVAVGGAVAHMNEKGEPLHGLPQAGDPMLADAGKAPALEPYIIHPFLMVRRAAIEAAGGYRHVPNSEDSDLYWRLMEHGRLVNLSEVLGRYRVHTASVSSSIVAGRVMAIGSQLGALSALRRRAREVDLTFDRTLPATLKEATTLEAMCASVAPLLKQDEFDHLRIAAAAKLMELARYRPYELEHSDCAFIRAALPLAKRLAATNQNEIGWYVSVTAARLIRKGLWHEALTLAPPTALPKTVARILLQR